ncbi:MAG: hypothetical protein LBS55_06430 [Prevotellaceae bacterium]|jgi:hypothetical protein|nr:hypothetical protein [Prevotellaceae bacterium]
MNCKIRDSKLNVLQAEGLLLARRSQRLRQAVFFIFTCIWTIQLSYAQYETNDTVKLYRQDIVSTYPSPSPSPPDFKIYGDNYRYAVQQTSYIIISGNDGMSITGDKIVSSGIIILKNDNYYV